MLADDLKTSVVSQCVPGNLQAFASVPATTLKQDGYHNFLHDHAQYTFLHPGRL